MHQPPLQGHLHGEVGRFEFRNPDPGRTGVVIGVPHGTAEQSAIEFAQTIRDGTGGGLVVAYDFKSKRIQVAQPLVHTSPVSWRAADSSRPGSVYPEYKNLLQSAALGPIKFYVGVRFTESASPVPGIEVTASGFSFKQLKALKRIYAEIRNRRLKNLDAIAKIGLAINPLDDIGWNSYDVRNHGVLMLAEKGLILRLPKVLADPALNAVYREILTHWVQDVLTNTLDSASNLQAVTFERMTYGRIDSILA